MKPTRNHTYCLSCRRPKMLFETKEKADAFIRFNSEEILAEKGKAPVRSYYCPLCCGYHVTSNPSSEEGESMDARDEHMIRQVDAAIKRRQEEKEAIRKLSGPIAATIEQVHILMAELRLADARELVSQILNDIEIAKMEWPAWSVRGKVYSRRAEQCLSLMEEYEAAVNNPSVQDEILSSTSKSNKTKLLQVMVTNRRRLMALDRLIEEIESAIIEGTKTEEIISLIDSAKEKVSEWKTHEIKSAKVAYSERLKQLERKVLPSEDADEKKKARKKAILSAINAAEKAASFYQSGNQSVMWFHMERAWEFLSEVEDCPEKAQVLAFLDRLTDKEDTEVPED